MIRNVIATVVAAMLIASCGSAQQAATTPSPSSSPSPALTTAIVTLIDGGCRYDGPASTKSGHLVARMVNQTKDTFFLGLGRIGLGHTYKDIVEWTDADRARELNGQPSVGPPSWMSDLGHMEIGAGLQGDFNATIGKGTLAFACGRLDLAQAMPEKGVWTVGPLLVI